MPTLYLSEQHSFVRKDGECLVVHSQGNGDNGACRKKVRVPLIKVDHVIVEGDVTLTTPALHALLDNAIEISFLSFYGNFKGSLCPGFSKNSLLRVAHNMRPTVTSPDGWRCPRGLWPANSETCGHFL